MKLSLGNLVGYFFAKKGDNSYLDSDKPISHVVGKNGMFAVRKNNLGSFIVKETEIPSLDDVHEGVFLDVPKIPFELFNHMVAWFKAVYEKDKTESTIMVFYNKEEGFKLWVPKQENAGAASNYKRDDDPEFVEMCKTHELVMVNHSHPWGGTTVSPSGIDDKDEKEAMLYMVVGNVCGIPNVYVSTCPGGKRIKLNFFDIFENPMDKVEDLPKVYRSLITQYVPEKGIFAHFFTTEGYEIPAEWWSKHSKYVAKTYNYGGGYQGSYWGNQGKVTHINTNKLDDEEEKAAERRARNYYGAYGYWAGDDEFDVDYKKTSGYSPYQGNYLDDDDDIYPGTKVIVKDAFDKTIEDYYDEMMGEKESINQLGDVIDAALELSDVKLAQLFYVLMDEGYEQLLRVCLDEKAKDDKRVKAQNKQQNKHERLDRATQHSGKNKDNKKEDNKVVTPKIELLPSTGTGAGVKAGDKPGIKLVSAETPKTPGLIERK